MAFQPFQPFHHVVLTVQVKSHSRQDINTSHQFDHQPQPHQPYSILQALTVDHQPQPQAAQELP